MAVAELLLAVVAGGGLTTAAGALARRGDHRREDRLRWLDDRRKVYADLVEDASEARHEAMFSTIAAEVDVSMIGKHGDNLREHIWAMEPNMAVLRLLAPDRVVRAAEGLYEEVIALLRWHVIDSQLAEPEVRAKSDAQLKVIDEAVRVFVLQARADLGAMPTWRAVRAGRRR